MFLITKVVVLVHFVVNKNTLVFYLLWVLAIGLKFILGVGKQTIDVFVLDPLCPYEVAFIKVFLLTLDPPLAILEYTLHKHVIVSLANVVLRRCLHDSLIDIVCLVNNLEHHLVHSILGIRQELFVLEEQNQIVLELFWNCNTEKPGTLKQQFKVLLGVFFSLEK